MLHPLDGAAFGRRLEALMTIYDPEVTAVELNLIGSHDAPRALTVLGGDRTSLRLAMVLQFTLPGAPCIYYGDEIGMEGDHDPDSRRAYPADPKAGDRDLRAFVTALTAARRDHVALRRGSVRVLSAAGTGVAYLREAEGHRAIVALNAGRAHATLALPRDEPEAFRSLALPGLAGGSAWSGSVDLPPQSALVLVDD